MKEQAEAAGSIHRGGDKRLNLKSVFQKFDLNGNGVIDREEFAVAIQHLGIGISPAELEVLWIGYDGVGLSVD